MGVIYLKGVVYLRNTVGIKLLENSEEEKNIAALRTLPLLNGIPEQDILKLYEHAQVVTYPRGAALMSSGGKVTKFSIILRGWIKLYRETQDGEESIVDLLTRGDVIGEMTMTQNVPALFGAQAVGASVTVCEIPLSIASDFLRSNQRFGLQLLTYMIRQSTRLRLHAEQLNVMSAVQRVAYFLHELHRKNGKMFQLPCDKSLIAKYLGMKPETFSRSLTELKESGVKVQGTQIVVNDAGVLLDYLPTGNSDADQYSSAA